MRRRFLIVTLLFLGCLIMGLSRLVYADTTDSTTYGSGAYGNCDFGSCTITLTSGTNTALDVVPTASGACSVASDTVSVLTDNDTGYTLTMTASTTDNNMTGGGSAIGTSSGTDASPVALAMNTWGYRVDGLSGFGTGPTSSQSSGSVPGVAFAGVPPSDQAATPVAASGAAANPAAETTVWYGLCANADIAAGAYSVDVTYTAVTN